MSNRSLPLPTAGNEVRDEADLHWAEGRVWDGESVDSVRRTSISRSGATQEISIPSAVFAHPS